MTSLTPVKSSLGIITHQGHISQVSAKVSSLRASCEGKNCTKDDHCPAAAQWLIPPPLLRRAPWPVSALPHCSLQLLRKGEN